MGLGLLGVGASWGFVFLLESSARADSGLREQGDSTFKFYYFVRNYPNMYLSSKVILDLSLLSTLSTTL